MAAAAFAPRARLAATIQSIEGYVIGPLIQRQAVDTPPAWTLVAIVILGALFGVMGIALAMPLVAVGRVAIIRFYVEDYLGAGLEQTFNKRTIPGG